MSQTVIKVENLYKEYKLGVINHGTIAHDLQSWWAKLRGREDPNSLISAHHNSDADKDSFLALKDISFEVQQGDRIGIIGKNGAGKSTLLKILSKITSPTKGQIKIQGRVASLLEVGTGFHPELTGRENVYLNGAILGMNKKEISRKLDEIIDFAGVEKHIDTPVKRYSSGMNVRLGFAVAAHLEPEILIVDEVLAVGDMEFQKKALGKMEDVSKGEGRTILFVSHNMGAVKQLCTKGILLTKSELSIESSIDTVIDRYLDITNIDNILTGDLSDESLRSHLSTKNRFFSWKQITIKDKKNKVLNEVQYGEPFKIVFKGYSEQTVTDALIGLGITNTNGEYICTVHQSFSGKMSGRVDKGWSEYEVMVDPNILLPGNYYVVLAFENVYCTDHIEQAVKIVISGTGYKKDYQPYRFQAGSFYYPYEWTYKHKK